VSFAPQKSIDLPVQPVVPKSVTLMGSFVLTNSISIEMPVILSESGSLSISLHVGLTSLPKSTGFHRSVSAVATAEFTSSPVIDRSTVIGFPVGFAGSDAVSDSFVGYASLFHSALDPDSKQFTETSGLIRLFTTAPRSAAAKPQTSYDDATFLGSVPASGSNKIGAGGPRGANFLLIGLVVGTVVLFAIVGVVVFLLFRSRVVYTVEYEIEEDSGEESGQPSGNVFDQSESKFVTQLGSSSSDQGIEMSDGLTKE
jgi:hypothetical protein